MDRIKVKKLVISALIAALSYIGFAIFKIDINIAGVKTAFHLGNTFVILGSLLLGGLNGGIAGAIGLTIADLTTGYVIYAPTTFLLKLMIGIVCGLVAHNLCKINTRNNKEVVKFTIISTTVAMSFNAIFDPLFSFVRAYIMFNLGFIKNTLDKGPDIAKFIAKMSSITTLVNAITTIIVVTIIYLPILNLLKKQGYNEILAKKENIHE